MLNASSPLTSLQETITTCRFAQRVALIKNEAVLNEELDPKLVSTINGSSVGDCKHILFSAVDGSSTKAAGTGVERRAEPSHRGGEDRRTDL